MTQLQAWSNFYVVIGTAGGSLTGLTFVVITLTAGRRLPGQSAGLAAFTMPTIVHFGAVLLVAALLSAPWKTFTTVTVLLVVIGACGVGYSGIVLRRLRRVENYLLMIEDWVWYGIFPLAAYAALGITATLLPRDAELALFGIAGAILLLLFLGIRNSWDVVTYLVVEFLPKVDRVQDEETGEGER